MRRRRLLGFGIIESLISLFIIGIILGVVARGYQALNRLQLASYQMSIRLELMSFLHRLSYEASSALTLTTTATGFTFQRVNPTLNLNYYEPPPARLPWRLDPVTGLNGHDGPPATTTGMFTAPNLETTSYAYDAASLEVRRTAFGATSVMTREVGEFAASTTAGGRILRILIRPSNMTAPVVVRTLLPVVTP
jgi:type II secretory pathway pseudopilin PulG